jgi:hypothetical protein
MTTLAYLSFFLMLCSFGSILGAIYYSGAGDQVRENHALYVSLGLFCLSLVVGWAVAIIRKRAKGA